MKINIVGGRGIMGRVHKPVFEKAGHEVIISGRKTPMSMIEAAQYCDVSIISVPINVTEDVIRKVAPYCKAGKAIMDFTSLKVFPIKAMLQYSNKDCEVGGLHPLYGEVSSISKQGIIYCPTERSGKKCNEVVKSLEKACANVKRMSAEEHDYLVQGMLQNVRASIRLGFALMLKEAGYDFREIYEVSPPPTKIELDLTARQVDESNDKMYFYMRRLNPNQPKIDEKFLFYLEKAMLSGKTREEIREFFGKELRPAQRRARKLVEIV